MKKVIQNISIGTISIDKINNQEHFIAFKTAMHNWGYTVPDHGSQSIIRLMALSGSAANHFLRFPSESLSSLIKEIMDSGGEVFVFDNRREFFTFLAEKSE